MDRSLLRRRVRHAATVVFASFMLLGLSRIAGAGVSTEVVTVAGIDVLYRIVLPDDYEPDRGYPAVLAFAGGGQTLPMPAARTADPGS